MFLGLSPELLHQLLQEAHTSSIASFKGKEREQFEEFDPDDMPSLEEAVQILFPSLRDVNPARGGYPPRRTEDAEQEYETEMTERLQRVSPSRLITSM